MKIIILIIIFNIILCLSSKCTERKSLNLRGIFDKNKEKSYAKNISQEIVNISYLYGDDDIRGVIKNRLGDSVYISPAVPFIPELFDEVATAALEEAKAGKPALIPVNLGSHWTALAIRKKSCGKIIILYNDSMGDSYTNGSESSHYITKLKQIEANLEVFDLQVHQQTDGTSCGAYTSENLIAFAKLDDDKLTAEAAKAVLGTIINAQELRNKQILDYC